MEQYQISDTTSFYERSESKLNTKLFVLAAVKLAALMTDLVLDARQMTKLLKMSTNSLQTILPYRCVNSLNKLVNPSPSFTTSAVACSNSILTECNFTMHFNQVYFTQHVTYCEWIRHKVTSEPDFLSTFFSVTKRISG